ncbi:MAG: heliorhodopsin HeR [Candidatus Berkelbacteria bacterium]|nr:heliorhodopsin HeR [Candidatus Berkelbacteria bacterium]
MTKEKTTIPEKSARNLRGWNIAMGFLHLAQSVVMLILSSDFSLPVIGNFLNFNASTQSLQPAPEMIFNLQIGPAVAAFLFLSAIAHFAVSTVFYGWYIKKLANHINPARWIEYAFSSSLMIIIIAMLVGIYELSTLIVLFGLNASMILFGWLMELHNQTTEKTDWTSFIFGCIAGIIPWVAIAIYLFAAGEGEYRAPNFVYWIYFSIFIFFNCFAINQVLQYKKVGRWQDYLYGEKAYIILSLVAKSLLAWQVFAGTLRPM